MPDPFMGLVSGLQQALEQYGVGTAIGAAGTVSPDASQYLANLLRADNSPAATAGEAFGVGPPAAINVFHGSPYLFDRFSTEHIGSGEGSQAYGHGLYFAENPETAAAYQRLTAGKLGPEGASPQGGFADSAIANMFMNRKAAGLSDDVARQQTMDWASRHPQIGPDAAQAIVPNLKTRTGNVYEASLRQATPEAEAADPLGPQHFLDWDKLLSEQSPYVQSALSSDTPMTGGQLHNEMALAMGREGAAQQLQNAGIAGIRYLDKGSRASGEGTHNYVLFNDMLVNLLRHFVPQ